ncbi:MAG TPA: GMC family oxidoreductase [Blastocatellia bacterium]|nr:GMC family oxidoreductase [Blastocatellia bacterium]
MLVDARELPAGEVIEADICVVGGGPAGMTLAREFAGQDFRVCVLESGGLQFEEETQSLCEGETEGEPYHSLREVRRRQLGGTANLWDTRLSDRELGFRSAPLDGIDFERKDWLPYSGWPFGRSHLDPFYQRAQTISGFGPYIYDGADWEDDKAPRLAPRDSLIATAVWQFGPQRTFTEAYREELQRTDNIAVLMHANVLEIETNESASAVTHMRAACLHGSEFRVSARLFILAAGGIENARLLLLSDQVQKNGLGNDHDLVGRFFMEHPFINCGTFIPASRDVFDKAALYDVRQVEGATIMGMLKLDDEVMRRERLLNFSLLLLPQHGRYQPEAINSLKAVLSRGMRGRVPERSHLSNVIRNLDFLMVAACRKMRGGLFPYIVDGPGLCSGGGWSSLDDKKRRYSVFKAFLTTEQAPDPNNRVTLSDERDGLGCRRTRLSWRWGEVNIESISKAQSILAEEVARAGLGRLQIAQNSGMPLMASPGLHHHMGTTRMHDDPRQGVVDENCQVHGVSNLFIAGSSVFPTGGYINPTLTIIALSIRLADHVKKTLNASSSIKVRYPSVTRTDRAGVQI